MGNTIRKTQVYFLVRDLANVLGIPFPEPLVKSYIMNMDEKKLDILIKKVKEWVKNVQD